MEAPTLDAIPSEIYATILGFLPDRRDINNLCKTSKKMYKETVSCLYESISLNVPEKDLDNLDMSKSSAAREKGLFQHTRYIKVWSHFFGKTSNRCKHKIEDSNDFYEFETPEKVARDMECLLRACEPGKIRSFDWSTGTCVPDSLLGRTGFLTLNQQNIESIRLVTDGICRWNAESGRKLALGTFSNLKRLSWTGLSSQGDFDSLANVLDQVSHQLEELEIDLTYHQDWCNDRGYESNHKRRNTKSIAKMLGLSTPRSSKFPVLKRLALTAVRFPQPKSDSHISGSLGFDSLQSLKLRNCHGWELLLERFTNRAEPFKLSSLELHCAATSSAYFEKEDLVDVIQKTHGLEELFLSTGRLGVKGIVELWKTVFHHRASLRRFVHHMLDVDVVSESGNFGGYRDISDLGLSVWQQIRYRFHEPDLPALQPVGSLDLTSFGLCCAPGLLQRLVSDFASNNSLQVLHLRQSGKDLEHYPYWANANEKGEEIFDLSFKGLPEERLYWLGDPFKNLAQWVFGPNGIRSLRLLAYGDFSGGGLYKPSTLLLCRRDESLGSHHAAQHFHFREVRPGEDTELWELYEREKHVLEACPRDSLLRLDNLR